MDEQQTNEMNETTEKRIIDVDLRDEMRQSFWIIP